MTDKQPGSTLPPLSGGGINNRGSNGGGSQQAVNLHQVLTTAQGLNVLTTGGGQQYVITSQVPGLTQVLPSGATTTANLQQLNVTRIVNIGGTSPRVSVVGVANASGSPLSSPSRQTPTKVVLTTSPKLVRTSLGNMFVAPSSQVTGQSPPARKRLKLIESTEKLTTVDDSIGYRRRIMEHKMKRMRTVREKYAENAAELFFLHAGGSMMDFQTWRKRPPTPQYLHFLRQHRLDPEDDDEDLTVPLPALPEIPVPQITTTTSAVSQGTEVKVPGIGVTPVAVSTTLPTAVVQLSQQGGKPLVVESSQLVTANSSSPSSVPDKPSSTSSLSRSSSAVLSGNQPVVKLVKLPASTVVAASCDTSSNQEQIVEKAKQEAYVMQKIAELQREGLWSERRLPKVQEPARTKAHWDYLLEEMVWLAADFAQERKWKKAAAKKCARMVQKHFQEKAIQAQKAEKLQELRLKKIAGFVAKEIKTFWSNVEKLVEYKQHTRLEEKRKKALDQHLNFIVGQTEKYSTWLTEGLNKTEGNQSGPVSMNSSRISSPILPGKQYSDDEFEPNQCSDDDEETIARAEEEIKSNHKEEVELLKKESVIPLEDLLKDLPPNYLNERTKSLSPEPKETVEEENEKGTEEDAEFTVVSGESSDDENTIMEQEKLEKNEDHKQELDDLEAENEMSIDELMAKYGSGQEIPMDVDEGTDQESEGSDKEEDEDQRSEDSESESEYEDNEQDTQTQSEDETGVGLKSLLEDLSGENSRGNKNQESDCNEMDDVAALAESIQPKGNTLLTTSVVTKIPFLLKHSLREYQHIGLDWLVTMYDRKLNGILADEMGLGKTIQTIALLAHLACEKGNWGPHLIIVPTSVMLNWEMECKKWCPGFKILTYYGTQKERKQKRTGWTKPNAFHICITSYKLVIQDHQSFRRKKWKYLILDEAQNIKNFKSQRWQLLLNFQTQRRLLLTGTPLQNNLMELWSLMHFLMPNVFQSHREFKEWFSNPVTGMIEGSSEYNENIIRRLHKVLRPFLLRRLKTEVEKQLPKKYEHVVMCRLSKRQRYLYDDFMSRAKTKETLASGNLLSVINVLMQLRKVCNHPNLFEVRPTVSPFQMEGIEFFTASLVASALDYNPFKHVDLVCLNLLLINLEFVLTAFVAHRVKRLQPARKLIEEIDSAPEPPPRCPPGKIKINVRLSNQKTFNTSQQAKAKTLTGAFPSPRVGTSPLIKGANSQTPTGPGVTLRVASGQQLQGYSVQLVPHQGSVKAIPIPHNLQTTATVTPTTTVPSSQKITVANTNIRDSLQRITTQTVTVKQGDSVQRIAVPPGFAQLVQTASGRHILFTSNQQNANTVVTPSGQRLTVLSKSLVGLSTTAAVNKVISGVVTTSGGRPVMRMPQLNVSTSQAQIVGGQQQIRPSIIARPVLKEVGKIPSKEEPKSEFHMPQLEEERRRRRQNKLRMLANVNERRCAACPLYGEDLFTALRLGKPFTACRWHNGWVHCATAKEDARSRRQFFSRTEALAEAIKSTEQIVEELKEVFEKFLVYVPAVRAPMPRFHVSHPPPHRLWAEQRLGIELKNQLSPKLALLHPVTRSMLTQFPDPRLIQYDCGKLQSLNELLRRLKSGNHRVLIFTQMTRMLDVLEAFLNFHGHIYLRLDGATKVDQRQVLMERFNADKRIFCFILSTRSGGVGVNLTGADTVIFYDSDWNPTMDAQAQDRCHRIGQTRDVHIYRLVSEKTVEENILKKANQKRLLGDLAIEGGNFTTAYFKTSTIQDLFNVDQTEGDASSRMSEVLDQNRERERVLQKETSSSQHPCGEEKAAIGVLESALAAAEEDLDVQAAKTAKAEAVAELAEFDENIPLDEPDKDDAQVSKAEIEVQNLVSQLTPIERYAMKFVEESEGSFSAAQLAAAERELEEQKKEWELDRLRALREEEERQMRLADDDDDKPLTFGREDAQNQVNSSINSKKLLNKKAPPSRKSLRRSNRRIQDSSESETETTSDSESESQEDEEELVEDSPDEESSHTESQSQGDDDEEDANDEVNSQDECENGSCSKNKGRSSKQTSKNKLDLNSPRTRSRGNVKINLWTLDVSPILPGANVKYKPRGLYSKKRFDSSKSDDSFTLPLPPNVNKKANLSDTQSPNESRKCNDDSEIILSPILSLEKLEMQQINCISKEKTVKKINNISQVNGSCPDEVSSLSFRDVQNCQKSDDQDLEKNDTKAAMNSITTDFKDFVSSGHVTRSSHKSSNFGKTANSNNDEDTENCDVNNASQNRKSSFCQKRSTTRTSGENSKDPVRHGTEEQKDFTKSMKPKLQESVKNSTKNLLPHVLLSACTTQKLKPSLVQEKESTQHQSSSPSLQKTDKVQVKKQGEDPKPITRSAAKSDLKGEKENNGESSKISVKESKDSNRENSKDKEDSSNLEEDTKEDLFCDAEANCESKSKIIIPETPRISIRRTKINTEVCEGNLELSEEKTKQDSGIKSKTIDPDLLILKTFSKTAEQIRVTRSNAVQLPLPKSLQNLQKPSLKRRPDTPMPNINSPHTPNKVGRPRKKPLTTEEDKPIKCVTKSEGNFLTPSLGLRKTKLSGKQILEKRESSPLRNKTIQIENTDLKRRPDTPMPLSGQKIRSTRKSVSEKVDVESNGNIESDETVEVSDKPQRTAKVVALLSLDSLSKCNNKSTSSQPVLEVKLNKVNVEDKSETSKNSEHSKDKNNSENRSKSDDRTKSDESTKKSLAVLVTNPTISLNRCEASSITTRASNKFEKHKIITTVDLDSEPDFEFSTSTKTLKKRVKKNRLAPLTKPLIDGKSGEIQTVDVVDEEEEIPPIKRSLRLQAPPPEKLNNSSTS